MEHDIPKVEVTRVGKVASGLVFIVCALSLVTWQMDDTYIVAPLFASIIAPTAIFFYILSLWIEHQYKSPSQRKPK